MLNERYELHHDLLPTRITKFSLMQSRREAELRRENILKFYESPRPCVLKILFIWLVIRTFP